jgi:hypothetical protein
VRVSVNHVRFPSSFGNQVVFSSSSFGLTVVASVSVQGRSVRLSCFVETREILASSWSCRSKEVRLPSCHLLSLRAKAWSLCTMSLRIDSLVFLQTRSFQLICINCINKGVRVFLGSQINLCLATSRFTWKYSNHLQLRIALWALSFKTINRRLYC